jgi:hypothetical protein
MRMNDITVHEWEHKIFTVHEWEHKIFIVHKEEWMIFSVHEWEQTWFQHAHFQYLTRKNQEWMGKHHSCSDRSEKLNTCPSLSVDGDSTWFQWTKWQFSRVA